MKKQMADVVVVSSEIEFMVVQLAIEFSGNNDLTGDHQTGGADQQIKKLDVIPPDCVAKTPKGPPQMSMSHDQEQHPETVQPIGFDRCLTCSRRPMPPKIWKRPTPRRIAIMTLR